ncbi:MAK10-like protein [Tanacetum coccineum]
MLISPFHLIQCYQGTFKEATISQTILRRPEIEIKPQQLEEPKPTLEDEFQDLHLNLPVLEVLAHVRDSKPFDTLADLGSCVNIIPLYLFKKLNIGLFKETDHVFGLADGTKSYPIGILKDVEVHIGELKLLNYFYVIDIKKDPETPFLGGRGFLATANAIIDCRMAKIAVGEGITRESYKPQPLSDGMGARTPYYARKDFLDCHLPGEWEIARDAELNPFRYTLVFRSMVEFLGAIPINLKSNIWELEDLIKKPINWDKPPKNGDVAWHTKIRLIDLDREEFTKTLQSIPITRKLSKRESPREIIDLDHFYDTVKEHVGRVIHHQTHPIGQSHVKNDTLDDKKAQEKWEFTLVTLSKEAQAVSIMDCQAGNPCEIRCDPTTKIALPIIERMYGQDWRSHICPQEA